MTANIDKYPKLKEVAQKLGIDPKWLWVVIQHESGWNPAAINPTTKALGLIQFMPDTLKGLGTSPATLLKGGINGQLDWTYKYLLPYKGKMSDLDDVYFAVFYPYAIGKPDSYVLGSQVSPANAKKIANQNPANNPNKDNSITVAEVKKIINDKATSYGVTGGTVTSKVKKLITFTPELKFKLNVKTRSNKTA